MNILFLTTVLPARKLHGSEIASQNIIDALTKNGCQVSVVGYARKEDGEVERTEQEILVSEQYVETRKAKFYPLLWFGFSLLRCLPYSAGKYYSKRYVQTVQSLLETQVYDAVIIDHSQLGWLLNYIGTNRKVIFTAHNIEHEIYQQHYKNARNAIARLIYQREARLIQAMETTLTIAATETWTLTQHDADYFASVSAGTVRTLSLPSAFTQIRDQPVTKKFDIGLIGSWPWKPNEEGLNWFLQVVYPYLPPNVSIHVAGRGADWLADKYANVTYRGFVPDAQEFMAEARVVAIPMLSGGGIQIKTLDAIATGSPIVATPVALRGIAQPPDTVAIAAEPEQFAQCLVAAINTSMTPTALENTRNWYRDRQTAFVSEIGQSLRDLERRGCDRVVSYPLSS